MNDGPVNSAPSTPDPRLLAALADAPAGLIQWSRDGEITLWTGAAPSIFGWSADERLGRPLDTLFPAEEQEALAAMLLELDLSGRASARLRSLTKDGRLIECDWRHTRLLETDGQPTSILSFVLDMSAQVRAEQNLKRAMEQNEAFISALSHELRDPLAPLRNAAYLLRAAAPDAGQRSQIVQLIERQIDQMTRRLDRLLDASRTGSTPAPVARAPVHLQLALREAVEQVNGKVDAAGQTLLRKVPSQVMQVSGDAPRITQMVATLLDNASRHTPPGGLIELALTVDGTKAVITVTDNGHGIEPERLPQLFDGGATGDVGDSDNGGEPELGAGLALATVKALAAAHGGTVRAHSDGSGQGTRFTLELPLLTPATSSETARAQPAVAEGKRRLRVIVVDDNRDNADTLNTLLTMMGHRVRVGYDGQSALAAASEDTFDAMLLDVGLPDLDGYEVARRLRAQGIQRPLIAVSGFGQARDKERALAAGFDNHLTKPVSIRDVVAVLAQVAQNAPEGDRAAAPRGEANRKVAED